MKNVGHLLYDAEFEENNDKDDDTYNINHFQKGRKWCERDFFSKNKKIKIMRRIINKIKFL